MKERPILFKGEMVRAILNGTKTQTRRIIKAHVPRNDKDTFENPYFVGGTFSGDWWYKPFKNGTADVLNCPFGKPGDELWVRETYCETPVSILYRATYKPMSGDGLFLRWKPSIFMPRRVARIILKITNVRVERLQDITEEDAKAEGTTIPGSDKGTWLQKVTGPYVPEKPTYREHFKLLWETINAKRGYGWDTNPWLWVIEFERIKP